MEFNKDLWKQAQENAKALYETEYGKGNWDNADKYEREDWVFSEYDKLKKEIENMAQMRDEKGRFVSSKNTTEYGNNVTINNTINNEKENDVMMNNKMNAKEERMNKLTQAGIDTANFFDLSLRVPMGADVHLTVNGKEMTFAPSIFGSSTKGFVVNGKEVVMHNGDLVDAKTGEVILMGKDSIENDPIAQDIIENGYVKNSKLFRRWITAHTFKMLNYQKWNNPNRKGWEACMKDCYSYNYQFEMMLEEIHVLSILQKEDKEAFEERTHFFNGNVVIATLTDYQRRLRKYIEKQKKEKRRMYKGHQYVKLARYGNVFIGDLHSKVYTPIYDAIRDVESAVRDGNYKDIYWALKDFMDDYYNKLPHDTTKAATWKDAFKASGAYYTLLNLIRFHEVNLRGCENKYESENDLKALLNGEFKGQEWRFHQLLVDTIEYNNFNLRKSIAAGHSAK